MNEERQIIDCIRRLVHQPNELISGIVVPGSVDINSYTCSVQLTRMDAGDTPLANVMLSAVSENGSGMISIPADGSNVIIGSLDGPGEYFLAQCSNLQKVLVTIGSTTYTIDANGIVMNGGSNGGMSITPHLVTRLNNLEQDINNLKTAIKSWAPVPNDGGAALKTASASWAVATLTQTQQSDIEDTKVKH